MHLRRFYLSSEKIVLKETEITGSDAYHIYKVLRLRKGDQILVFDGQGKQSRALILLAESTRIRVSLTQCADVKKESFLELTVAQGYLKDKKMDILVRQLTELGVIQWVPFFAHRCIPAPDEQRLMKRMHRWKKISIEALKQCGRSCPIRIESPRSFQDALKISDGYDMKVILWEGCPGNVLPVGPKLERPKSVFLIIGPEGGFENYEIQTARQKGFTALGMGERILRAETATLAACVMVQHLYGDMGIANRPEDYS
ncbi:MAG: 16S rRNA (uracil(1498)-N(3))-methyltransferase [Desulfobacteraceae bacterium]|nr:16S rRNA (uracil(1498)-N(3))-methyltransferase [Desulfobacteraceae bacterium]